LLLLGGMSVSTVKMMHVSKLYVTGRLSTGVHSMLIKVILMMMLS